MPRLSKKRNKNGIFSQIPKRAEEHTTAFALNAKTNASKVTKQSLFSARSTNPKEVQKALKIAVNMMTAVNLI